jgi:hypothetical protein
LCLDIIIVYASTVCGCGVGEQSGSGGGGGEEEGEEEQWVRNYLVSSTSKSCSTVSTVQYKVADRSVQCIHTQPCEVKS